MRVRAMGAVAAALVLGMLGRAGAEDLPARPLTLAECLALARAHNPSLVVAQQQVYTSEAGVVRVVSQYFPTATLLADYGRAGGSSFVQTAAGPIPFAVATSLSDSEVVLNQTVFAVGRREALLSARYALRASQAGVRTTEQNVALAVAQLYYGALAAQELVKVSQASLDASRDHEKLVKALVKVGESAPVDVAPAEADAANAEFTLLQSENAAAVAKAKLKNGIGLPATYQLELATPSGPPAAEAVPELAEAVRIGLEQRPEMASARDAVSAAGQQLRAAELQREGTLALSAQYDRGLSGPEKGASWTATVSLSGFLFDGGALKAGVVAARANLETLRAQEQQAANQVQLDVESARLNADTARKSIEAGEKAVTSAEAQLAAAEGKYRRGVGIFVEILDAQRVVAQARTNRVQAQYNYQTALVALQQAMGQLTLAGEGKSLK